jgi:hypothetical protein
MGHGEAISIWLGRSARPTDVLSGSPAAGCELVLGYRPGGMNDVAKRVS